MDLAEALAKAGTELRMLAICYRVMIQYPVKLWRLHMGTPEVDFNSAIVWLELT